MSNFIIKTETKEILKFDKFDEFWGWVVAIESGMPEYKVVMESWHLTDNGDVCYVYRMNSKSAAVPIYWEND